MKNDIERDFILVYKRDDYPENGGGLYIEYPKSITDLENRVNILNDELKERFAIEFAGEIRSELILKPVTRITKYEVEM